MSSNSQSQRLLVEARARPPVRTDQPHARRQLGGRAAAHHPVDARGLDVVEAGRHVVREAALEVDELGQRLAAHPRRAQVAQAADGRGQAVPALAHALEHVGAQVRAAQRDGGERPALLAEGLAQRGQREARHVAAARMGHQHDVALRIGRRAGDALAAHRGDQVRHVLRDAQEGVVLEAPGGALVQRGQAGPEVRGIGGGGGAVDSAEASNAAAVPAIATSRPTPAAGMPAAPRSSRIWRPPPGAPVARPRSPCHRARLGVERGLYAAARRVRPPWMTITCACRRCAAGGVARARRGSGRPALASRASACDRRRARRATAGPPGLVGLQARRPGRIAIALRRRADAALQAAPPGHASAASARRRSARARSAAPARPPASRRRDGLEDDVGVGRPVGHRGLDRATAVQRDQPQRRMAASPRCAHA